MYQVQSMARLHIERTWEVFAIFWKGAKLNGGVQVEEFIVVFNHDVINLYFTAHKSTTYTSYYDNVHIQASMIGFFTCLHDVSLCLICHFFLIPLNWWIRPILLNSLASGCFQGFSEKKHLNTCGFGREFLQKSICTWKSIWNFSKSENQLIILSYHNMESIVNFSLGKAYVINLPKHKWRKSCWNGDLGYNTWIHLKLCVWTTTNDSLAMHLRKFFVNAVWYLKSTRNKSMQTLRQGGLTVSTEDHIQNFVVTGNHKYYICLLQLKFMFQNMDKR